MLCPDCGYEADDASIFCPHCRYQFRDVIEEEPAYTADTFIDLPERGIITDETILEETPSALPGPVQVKAVSGRELAQLEIQLLQPSLLVVLIVAFAAYSMLSGIPFVPVTWNGITIGIAGIVSLACGLCAGILFFLIIRWLLLRFRYR